MIYNSLNRFIIENVMLTTLLEIFQLCECMIYCRVTYRIHILYNKCVYLHYLVDQTVKWRYLNLNLNKVSR